MARSHPAAVLAVVAVLLLLPSLALGTLISHSSPQNLTWAAQFSDQFRAGIVYPRWLPDSFDGLGSPAFYFYPPLGFWVDALVSVATFDVFSVSHRLSLSAFLLLWASGLGMLAWLETETKSPRAALYGALAYMAAPYHLLDHYYRGAYAEFAAYAVLPLVMLSIRRIAEDRPYAPMCLAVAYAALPMAHLPTALLVSLTALPIYVLYRGGRLGAVRPAARFFSRCVLGGVLGLGLAAIYLLPALGLQHWIPADTFWTSYYHVENWFLLTPSRWPPSADMMQIIAWSGAAYAIAAIGVLASIGRGRGLRSEAALWAMVCLLCLLLIAGAVPWFWRLPFVAKVQFPWRLMIVVEFAIVTALSLAPWPGHSRAFRYIVIAAILVLVPGLAVLGSGVFLRMEISSVHQEAPQDLKQFEPAGFPQKPDGDYADLGLDSIGAVPAIACTPAARLCDIARESFDGLRIEIDVDAPSDVVLRRFYYPFWRLDPPEPIVATDPSRLVSFNVPPGRRTYRLQRAVTSAERIGWMVSGLSLAVLLVWAAVARPVARAT